jgi:hypothetical protein
MIEGVPPHPRGDTDALSTERRTRVQPCVKTTWCTEHDGHAGPCLEEPRTEHAPEDFGPEASKRRRY